MAWIVFFFCSSQVIIFRNLFLFYCKWSDLIHRSGAFSFLILRIEKKNQDEKHVLILQRTEKKTIDQKNNNHNSMDIRQCVLREFLLSSMINVKFIFPRILSNVYPFISMLWLCSIVLWSICSCLNYIW